MEACPFNTSHIFYIFRFLRHSKYCFMAIFQKALGGKSKETRFPCNILLF